MKHLPGVLALGLAAALLSGGTVAAEPACEPNNGAIGDAEAGRIKADTCLGCHGVPSYTNAYPSFHVPKIGGQHARFLYEVLRSYKEGQREHRTMSAHAASLSDEDMRDIAAFFADAPR